MLRKINYILDKKQKLLFFILIIIILVASFLEMISISAMMPVVYLIVDPNAINSNDILKKLYCLLGTRDIYQFMVILLLGLIMIYIFRMLFLLFRNYYKYSLTTYVQRSIAKRMLVCYLYQPYTFHADNNSAEIQRNIINDVGTSLAAVLAFIDIIVGGLNCIVLAAFLLYTDAFTSLLLIGIFLIFGVGFMKPFSKILGRYGDVSRNNGEKMIMWLNQALGGIKEIKVKENERFFIKKFSEAYDTSSNAEKMNQFVPSIPSMTLETICFISILASVAYKVYKGEDLSTLISVLAALVLAGVKLLSSYNSLTSSISRVYYTKPALDALYNDLKELETLNICDRKKQSIAMDFQEEIRIENLSYRYPNTTRNVLEQVDFSIHKGESIALIGPSGAGKTTLADLILGVLEPTEGQIKVDNVNIWTDLEAWHSILGYIPQNIYLLDDTIENNITFGMEEKENSAECMSKALAYAQLQEFVDSLEMGGQTIVGERGARLSGGQRQRIGIARALYNNPQVLVLDEATSALDNDTEKAVMSAIENLQGKITIIIIAHRLTTIKKCDRIYEVIDGGIRSVSHEELNNRITSSDKE